MTGNQFPTNGFYLSAQLSHYFFFYPEESSRIERRNIANGAATCNMQDHVASNA